MYWILLLFLPIGLFAESYFGVIAARRGGEYVFETGNKSPNLSGTRAGSRIKFDRDYTMGGIEGGYSIKNLSFTGKFLTTGWYVRSGNARDEDFFLYSLSKEVGSNISGSTYKDTAYVFSGTRNFADGQGKSALSEYSIQTEARYYLGDKSGSQFQMQEATYLKLGLRYTYSKNIFYDTMQAIATDPFYYAPIGLGMTFTNNFLEVPFGFGKRWVWDKFYFDANASYIYAKTTTRDFHVQRGATFLSSVVGDGLLMNLETGYLWDENTKIIARLEEHRLFMSGSFTVRGGLSRDDINSNFLGNFGNHINLKEWLVELGAQRKL